MQTFAISCCSTVDTDLRWAAKRNIETVNFHFSLDEQEYEDDFGMTLTPSELYSRMLAGEKAKTSQVSAVEYVEHFRKILSEGSDLLHITLSSGISGTINSANTAAEIVRSEFPDRTIYIIDSLCASAGYGLLVDKAADLRDEGMLIDEVHAYIEENKTRLHHWFITTDLTFYIMGGRISKAAGAFGKLLKICPLLNVDLNGTLQVREKIRTKSKAIKALVDKMKENAENGAAYEGKCFISQSECFDDARQVADGIEEAFPQLSGKVEIFPIGATIGSHTGPGTIALFFWGNPREN